MNAPIHTELLHLIQLNYPSENILLMYPYFLLAPNDIILT